jgi:hypothetical protein
MTNDDVVIQLLLERMHRVELAVSELASETHAVSQPQQLVARGLPNLASLLSDHRAGVLGALEDADRHVTLERR